MSWLYEPDPGQHDLDETDVRVRPNPKGNKPRTKKRPEHKSAPIGLVTGVDMGRYHILLEEDERVITATMGKELRKAGAAGRAMLVQAAAAGCSPWTAGHRRTPIIRPCQTSA